MADDERLELPDVSGSNLADLVADPSGAVAEGLRRLLATVEPTAAAISAWTSALLTVNLPGDDDG